jgi:hypothetical protein
MKKEATPKKSKEATPKKEAEPLMKVMRVRPVLTFKDADDAPTKLVIEGADDIRVWGSLRDAEWILHDIGVVLRRQLRQDEDFLGGIVKLQTITEMYDKLETSRRELEGFLVSTATATKSA